MAFNPAIADAYRKVVVTTGTGSGGVPGTTVSQEVGGELNLDAGFGISLITDELNNKVTIVNTGNGTGALTTITENNKSGTYYPIFTRSPPGTQTFTVSGSDFTSGAIVSGVAEVRVTGSSNSVNGVSAPMRASLVGMIQDETFSLIRVSNGAVLNFTATGPATYSTINGYWTIPVTSAPVVTDTFVSLTIATGAGELNPITGTYQMDTMYLDQTSTPLTYNPVLGLMTVNTVSVVSDFAVTGHVTLEGVTTTGATGTGKLVFDTSPSVTGLSSDTVLVGTTANFTDWPNAKLVASQANSNDSHTYNIGIVGEAVGDAVTSTQWGVGVYGKGSTNSGTRSAGILGDGGVQDTFDTASAVGVRGYATSPHLGGLNIGLYSDASNGLSNFALYMNTGDIYSANAQTWIVKDNNATALSIDATGKTGILVVNTTGATGSVTMSGTLDVTGNATVGSLTSTTSVGIRDTTAAYNVVIGATSTSATLTANRALTLDVGDAARTVKLNGNLSLGGTFTTDNNVTIAGPYEITITPTGVFNATFPAGTYDLPKNDQTFYIGTTQVAINRASGVLTLSGVTSEKATNIVGGNSTTLLGSLPYQSNTDATSLLAPNTSTTRNFLRMTGTGTNGAAPSWDTVTQTDVGLSNVTNESKATMFTDPTFTGTVSLAPATFESVSVSATAATGTVNVSVKTNTVFYYTSSATANWTFNFRGDGSTTLDSYLATGKSITVVFLVTQGVTAFYPTAFTADGTSVTPKWLSGTAPTGGNASSVDSYSFTIIKTAAATYTILASQARFA